MIDWVIDWFSGLLLVLKSTYFLHIMSVIKTLIIKIIISLIVIGWKNSYFPLIHLAHSYQKLVIGQINKPITFKVVV